MKGPFSFLLPYFLISHGWWIIFKNNNLIAIPFLYKGKSQEDHIDHDIKKVAAVDVDDACEDDRDVGGEESSYPLATTGGWETANGRWIAIISYNSPQYF